MWNSRKHKELSMPHKHKQNPNPKQPENPVSDEVCPDSLGQNPYWPSEKALMPDDSDKDTKIPEVR